MVNFKAHYCRSSQSLTPTTIFSKKHFFSKNSKQGMLLQGVQNLLCHPVVDTLKIEKDGFGTVGEGQSIHKYGGHLSPQMCSGSSGHLVKQMCLSQCQQSKQGRCALRCVSRASIMRKNTRVISLLCTHFNWISL